MKTETQTQNKKDLRAENPNAREELNEADADRKNQRQKDEEELS